jgi:hypothetical protein
LQSLVPDLEATRRRRRRMEITPDSVWGVDDFSSLKRLLLSGGGIQLNGTLYLTPSGEIEKGKSRDDGLIVDVAPSMEFVPCPWSPSEEGNDEDDERKTYRMLRGFYVTRKDALIVKI